MHTMTSPIALRQGGFAGYLAAALSVMTVGLAIGGGTMLQMNKDSSAVQAKLTTDQGLQTAARYLANAATDAGGSYTTPADSAGYVPAGSTPLSGKDGYGQPLVYCHADGVTAANGGVIAIVSGGADKVFSSSNRNTLCANAFAGSLTGDKAVVLTKSDVDAIKGGGASSGGGGTALDASSQITVGKVTIGNAIGGDTNTQLNVEKDALVGGNVGAGSVSTSGNITSGGQLGGSTLAITSDGSVGGNLNVTGTLNTANVAITGGTISGTSLTGVSISGANITGGTISGATIGSVASTALVTNLNADLLDGQTGSWYQTATNLTSGTLPVGRLPAFNGDITAVANTGPNTMAVTVAKIQGRSVASTAPATGNILAWNGTSWSPMAAPSSGQFLSWNGSSWIGATPTASDARIGTLASAAPAKFCWSASGTIQCNGGATLNIDSAYTEQAKTYASAPSALDTNFNVHKFPVTTATVALPSAADANTNKNYTVFLVGSASGAVTWATQGAGGAIKWPGGTAPSMPASGTVAIFQFTTLPGTTNTWIGAKVYQE